MQSNLSFASRATRLIAAASLVCAVASCTSDRVPGAGAPERYMPSTGPMVPSATPGTESSRPVNPPMISSYTPAPGVVVTQRRPNLDALAIAAADQSYRGRYLGPADPVGVPSYVANPDGYVPTGQWNNPSLIANPEITVNSSISSPPVPVVTAGGGTGFTASAPAISQTSASPAIAASNVPATITTAASAAPAAVVTSNLGGFLNPTMSSGSTVNPTVASTPGVGNVGAGRTALTTTATARTTNNALRTSALTASSGSTGSLVVTRSTNGTVMITNTGSGLKLH